MIPLLFLPDCHSPVIVAVVTKVKTLPAITRPGTVVLSSSHTQTLNEASANGTNHELQTLLAEVTTLASLEATGFFLNG